MRHKIFAVPPLYYVALASSVLISYSFFSPTPVLALIIPILLMLIFKIVEVPTIPKWGRLLFVSFGAFIIAKNASNLLYPAWNDYRALTIPAISLILLLSVLNEQILSNRRFILISSFIFLVVGIAVVKISPTPKIDVHEVLTKSSKLVLEGTSPYFNLEANANETFFKKNNMENLYKFYEQSGVNDLYLPYSPHVILTSTIGYLLGDVRYISLLFILFFILFTSFSILKEGLESRAFVMTVTVTGFLLIEQAWNDPLPLCLFSLSLSAVKNKKLKLASFLVGITALSKLYMIILIPFYFVSLLTKTKLKDLLVHCLLFLAGLALPFLIMGLWGWENIWHYLTTDMWFFNDFDYPFSNSLTNQLSRMANIKLYVLSKVAVILTFLHFLLYKKEKDLISGFKYFVIALFFAFSLGITFFSNYAWALMAMVLTILPLAKPNFEMKFLDSCYLFSRISVLLFMPPILSDIWRYTSVASNVLSGKLPYLDFVFEYPPLALLQIMAPAYIAFFAGMMTFGFYRILFMLINLVFDYYFYQKLKREKPERAWFYLIGSSLMAPFYFERLDLMMMWFIVISLLKMKAGRFKTSLAFSIAGGWHKLIPFLSSVLIFKESNNKKTVVYGFIILNLLIITLLSFVFRSETLSFLNYHSERPYQIESLVASVVLFFSQFTPLSYEVVSSHGSQNLIFSYSSVLLLINKVLLGILVLGITFRFLKSNLSSSSYLFIFFLTAVTLSSVLSTQYMIWIFIPFLFSEFFEKFKKCDKAILLFAILLSTILFINHFSLTQGNPVYIFMLFFRNVLLLYLMINVLGIQVFCSLRGNRHKQTE